VTESIKKLVRRGRRKRQDIGGDSGADHAPWPEEQANQVNRGERKNGEKLEATIYLSELVPNELGRTTGA